MYDSEQRIVKALPDDNIWVEVKQRVDEAFSEEEWYTDGEKVNDFVHLIQHCTDKRDNIIVFSLEEGGSPMNIDVAMLKAVIGQNLLLN